MMMNIRRRLDLSRGGFRSCPVKISLRMAGEEWRAGEREKVRPDREA